MRPLFGFEGRAAIAKLMMERNALLAFNFDGTLAPIVPRPDDARVPLPIAARLQRLCTVRPVAVVTGRSLADVRDRLRFAPRFVIGNHGIEDPGQTFELLPARWAMALDHLRAALADRASQLAAAGVTFEDKRYSIALHHRLAPDEARARAAIESVLDLASVGLAVGRGNCVFNVVPVGAPDKGDAVLAAARRCDAGAGLFVGDDDNDEPVFEKVPEGWVTVRMGRDHLRSRASYYIDGPPQLPAVLQLLLDTGQPPELQSSSPSRTTEGKESS